MSVASIVCDHPKRRAGIRASGAVHWCPPAFYEPLARLEAKYDAMDQAMKRWRRFCKKLRSPRAMPDIDMEKVRELVRDAGESLGHSNPHMAIVKTLIALHAIVGLAPPEAAEKRLQAIRNMSDA